MVPPGKILPSHRLKNLTVAPVYTWLFVHPGRQRGQPNHRNDHPGDHVGHLRVERVLPRDVFLPGCHQEHLAQAQLGLCLFEAGAWTSDCHKVGLDTRSPLWCRVRIRKVISTICFALWDFQVASKQILKIFAGGSEATWAQPGGLRRRRPSDPSWPGFPLLLILTGEISYIFWNSMLNMKLELFCHLMNVYDFLTQNLPGGIRRSREVLEPEERSLVLQVLLNLFRNVISSYSYSCR